jgi:hypothetical protein
MLKNGATLDQVKAVTADFDTRSAVIPAHGQRTCL